MGSNLFSSQETLGFSVAERYDGPEWSAEALFSVNMVYRFYLVRSWSPGPMVAFVGLNPSKATAVETDHTVTKVTKYAQQWGFGSMVMLNLFALRSTDPKGLYESNDPIGGLWADRALDLFSLVAEEIVLCWGNHGTLHERSDAVRDRLRSQRKKWRVFKMNQNGEPMHPLMLPGDQERFEIN